MLVRSFISDEDEGEGKKGLRLWWIASPLVAWSMRKRTFTPCWPSVANWLKVGRDRSVSERWILGRDDEGMVSAGGHCCRLVEEGLGSSIGLDLYSRLLGIITSKAEGPSP